jgi:hypothetical protein
MDREEPVVIANAFAESEACVIKSLLESYDIPCHYASEFPTRIYPVAASGEGPIRIFVPAALAEDARKILEQHLGDWKSDQQIEN